MKLSPAPPAGLDRRTFLVLCGIMFSALLVRLVVASMAGLGHPFVGDEGDYAKAASSLAQGHGFAIDGVPTARRLPGWPALLAPVFAMLGPDPRVARVFSCVLGATLTLPLGLVAFRIGGRRAACWAASAAALFPPLVLYSTQALSETPTVLWFAVSLLLLFESRIRSTPVLFVLAGFALGMSCLTRGTMLAFAPAAMIAMIVAPSDGLRRALGSAGLLACGLGIVLLPWVARNREVMGQATLSTQSLTQLWQGAHPGATGRNRVDWPATKVRISQLGGAGEVEVSRVMGGEATEFIRENPAEFARLGMIKAWELWKPWSSTVGRTQGIVYALSSIPLILFGIASGFSASRTRFERLFLFSGLVLFTGIHMLYTSIARYRIPIDAMLIPYAAVLLAGWLPEASRVSVPGAPEHATPGR